MGKSQGRDREESRVVSGKVPGKRHREENRGTRTECRSRGHGHHRSVTQLCLTLTGAAVCQASLASTTSWSLLRLLRVWYRVERAANVREAESESWETTRRVRERKPRKPEAEEEHRPAAERSGADAQLWHPGVLASRKCPQTLLSAPSGQNQPQ